MLIIYLPCLLSTAIPASKHQYYHLLSIPQEVSIRETTQLENIFWSLTPYVFNSLHVKVVQANIPTPPKMCFHHFTINLHRIWTPRQSIKIKEPLLSVMLSWKSLRFSDNYKRSYSTTIKRLSCTHNLPLCFLTLYHEFFSYSTRLQLSSFLTTLIIILAHQ